MILQKTVLSLKKIYFAVLIIALVGILFPIVFSDVSLLPIIAGLFLLAVCVGVSKIDIKGYPVLLFGVMFLIRLIAVLMIEVEPTSDFEVLYTSALELVNGHNNMLESAYYLRWAYQAGVVAYLAILLSICKSLVFIKIVNCIWSAGICVLVYLIAREMTDKRIAQFVSLGYGLFPFSLLFNGVLSNQIPASFLFYLACYLLIKFRKKEMSIWFYLIPGGLLALGNVLRPEAIVFVCAVIGCYLLRVRKEKVKQSMLILLVFCFAYFAVFQACSLAVEYTNLNQYGLVNNDSKWKFVLGLNQETYGKYSQDDAEKYLGNEEAEREVIQERLKSFDLSNIGEFIKNKERTILSGGDFAWSLPKWDKSENPYILLKNANGVFYLCFYMLMIMGIIFSFRNIQLDDSLLFINVLAITMIVYGLIEVQARYGYIVQISVFLIAAKGCEQIKEMITVIRKKWQMKGEKNALSNYSML